MRRADRMASFLLAAWLAAAPARACPVCDREAGARVRAGIFDGRFGANLLATAAPFGVVLGVAAAIRFARWPRRRPGGDA